jgi:hypothetical protein
LEKEQFNS